MAEKKEGKKAGSCGCKEPDPRQYLYKEHEVGLSVEDSIIDYMAELKKTKDVKVNVTCRGYAMSAAAMILACATGNRSATKHSTIMLHEGSAFSLGKNSDIQASAKHSSHMEIMANNLLEEKTKESSVWWKDNTRTDLFLSAREALDLGVIDEII